MMRSQCSGLVGLALLVCSTWLCGCDDDAEVVRDTDSTSATEQPQPGGGRSGAGGAGDTASPPDAPFCIPSDCPAVRALGSAVPGCCQNDGTCGALVLVMGRPLCAPPNVDNLVAGAGSTLMQLRAETVRVDASCSERNILGTLLPGCCDQSGVCGVSTAPLASGSPGAIPGLTLPVTCVSPDEAAQLGGGMAALGAAQSQQCGGPASAADAGAAAPAVEPPSPPPAVEPPVTPADAGSSDAAG